MSPYLQASHLVEHSQPQNALLDAFGGPALVRGGRRLLTPYLEAEGPLQDTAIESERHDAA
jgi:hypothetical protein